MKKICSWILVLAMCLSFVPAVYAETPTGEIDLSTSGRICITDTGYIINYDGTYDAANETAYTGHYSLTGTIGGDTPIEIRNNSDNDVEYNITINDLDIQTDMGCPAISIYNTGTGKIQIYFYLEDNNTIISDGYPPFYVAEGGNVSIRLCTTSLAYDYTFYDKASFSTEVLFTSGAVDRFDIDGIVIPNEAVNTVGHTCSSTALNYNTYEHWYYCDHYTSYHNGFHNGTATCTSPAHCSVCNQDYSEIDSDAHDWSGWTYVDETTHVNVCSYNPLHNETDTHRGGTAYCYSGAYCDNCNDEYTAPDPNNHEWYDWEYIDETTHKRVCWGDLNHFEEGTHNFVDGECDTCGAPNTSDYTNVINGGIIITGDSGSEQGISWNTDGNTVTITLDDVVVFGNLILPNNISDELIVINVDSDSRIYGDIMFDNSSYRRDVTIQGNGKLEVSWFTGTGNGDRLNIYTDVEIDGDLFLGASGGMDSHLDISGATLEIDGDTVLIEELELSDKAKFIIHGHLSMHNTPVFDIEDGCEIQIMGDSNPSFYVESDTEPSWYQTLLTNRTLPLGYTMQVDSDTNYFSLHDDNNTLVTGAVVLKNKPDYNIIVSADTTKCSYTVTTGLYGANSVYTIEGDTVVLDVVVTDTDYQIASVEKVVDGVHTTLTTTQLGKYEITMPAVDVQLAITLSSGGAPVGPGIQPQPQPSPSYNDPSYKIEIEDIENGEIDSNRNYAESGDTVKLTVTPDTGYILYKLTVLDNKGKEIDVEKDGDTYKFRMPSGKVVVSGEFIKSGIYHSENCDRGESCPIWRFDDTNANAWYHDGAHYCIDTEIMIGYGDRVFKPDAPVTRAMVVTMLWRMENAPVVNYLMTYEDVDLGQWYTEAVRWASSEKIVSGYSSKEFGPNDIMTREQMVSVLHRYAQYKGIDVSVGEDTNILSYNDVFEVSEYAIPAMQWACGEGVIKGDNGNLMPKNSTTRAQVSNILFRYFKI